MTCIVGIAKDGDVIMGADSAGVEPHTLALSVRADEKIFILDGRFVIGFTSSFRMGQIIRYSFSPPPHEPTMTVEAYMAAHFVEALREVMKEKGYTSIDNNREAGGEFLVGYAGRLFGIEDDFQVSESATGYSACGSGQQVALGSLYATEGWQDQHARLDTALKAAEAFTATVRGPFQVRRIGKALKAVTA